MIRRQTATSSNIFVKKNPRQQRIANLSRADAVRLRREEAAQKPVEKRTQPAAKAAYNQVPFTMRSGTMGTPVLQRTRSNVRRQVIFPVGKTGAEMMMPSLPIIKPGWRLVSGFLVLFLTIFLILVSTAPEFKISTVEVSGLQRISPQDLTTALRISGKPIFLVDLQQVNTDITSLFTELTDVKVSVDLPAKLIISVKERQPYIEWHFNEMVSWIDEEGYIFPVRGEAQPAFTIYADSPPPLQPIPDLEPTEDAQDSAAGADATATPDPAATTTNIVDPVLLQGIRILNQQMPNQTILSYSTIEGFGWQDENNWNVYVGFNLDNLDQKLVVYQAIKNKCLQEGITPNMINVAYVHAPFYRMEP